MPIRPQLPAAVLSAVVLATALVVYPTQTVHAGEPTPTPPLLPTAEIVIPGPPLGDCFGGVLLEEPVHCYVLEEAQRQGTIDVEVMYVSPQILRIYLSEEEPAWDEIKQFFEARFLEFWDRWRGSVPSSMEYQWCDTTGQATAPGVIEKEVVKEGSTVASQEETASSYDPACIAEWAYSSNSIVPSSGSYDIIYLNGGGAEARRSVGGWASWRQVWPKVVRSTVTKDMDGTTVFDVSEVDFTNFPELDCYKEVGSTLSSRSCNMWERHPELRIAGFHVSGDTLYCQVKAVPGEEEERIQAARETLTQRYRLEGYELVVIPVKYDFEELWRWSVILDRFAHSAGNTIGIVDASVGLNTFSTTGVHLFPLDDLGGTTTTHRDELRETIRVRAHDLDRLAAALPQLLPQLGIPVDAVGALIGGLHSSNPGPVPFDAGTSPEKVVSSGPTRSIPADVSVRAESTADDGSTPAEVGVEAKREDAASDQKVASEVVSDIAAVKANPLPEKDQAEGTETSETRDPGSPPSEKTASQSGVSIWLWGGAGSAVGLVLLGLFFFLAVRRRAGLEGR